MQAQTGSRCILTDKLSLDMSKPFNPPNKSVLAMAAHQGKNGCKIQSKPFVAFTSQEQSTEGFSVKFVDFS